MKEGVNRLGHAAGYAFDSLEVSQVRPADRRGRKSQTVALPLLGPFDAQQCSDQRRLTAHSGLVVNALQMCFGSIGGDAK